MLCGNHIYIVRLQFMKGVLEMTTRTRNIRIVLCSALLVLFAGWVVASNEATSHISVPVGHYVEKDTSSIMLLNALRSITQARKAVVDNITNSKTISYKRNLVRFIDRSTVAMNRDFSQGELIKTDRSLDFAISGNGFVSVSDDAGNLFYTRCGILRNSPDGHLILTKGFSLEPAITVPTDTVQISIARDGSISCQSPFGSESTIGSIQLSRFPNDEGLSYKGMGLFSATEQSGTSMMGTPGSDGFGEIHAGFVESSNVNESEEIRILEELMDFEDQVQNALDIVRMRK